VQFGPPFVATAIDYRTMLRKSGWTIMQHRDVTTEYARAVGRMLREEEANAEALSKLYGNDEFSETLARRRMTVQIARKGFLRRELFAATPAPFPALR
jgi:hypothetical protein